MRWEPRRRRLTANSECSLYFLTETWLTDIIPDSAVSMPGFSSVRADRDPGKSGKAKGGGLLLLVNNKWCHFGHITAKDRICCRDVEVLAVRPYCVPRELSHIVAIIVYIPPHTDPSSACDVIQDTVARLQSRYSDALVIISGDFNHVDITSHLGAFTQYVTCPTRHNNTLDPCYINLRDAYSVTALHLASLITTSFILSHPTDPV